jgi:hypothetical protein
MKRLSFTQADMDLMLEEFKKSLATFRSNQEKFTYEKKFSEVAKVDESKVKKPIIYFAMEAWLKMLELVKQCDKEIAWQATVEKRKYKNKEDSEDFFYYIKNVLVYPQKVTGTFVDVDEVKYAEWSLQLEDEIYNNLRFQGHSHVNMGVSPSGTDLNTYQNFLDQLNKDDFYIFMILNKRSEFNIMVYDYKQDILFENKDCHVDILTSQGSLNKWTEEAMKKVEHKVETRQFHTWDQYEQNYYRYNAPTTPTKQHTPAKKDITYANISGYLENGKWNSFKNIDEAIDWFIDNPDYIDKAQLAPEHRKLIMNLLENEEDEEPKQSTKKRGRPAKGSKK